MSYNYLLAADIRQEHPAKVRADPRHESPLRYRAATKSKPRMVLHKSCNTRQRQRQFESCATARRSTDCDENNHGPKILTYTCLTKLYNSNDIDRQKGKAIVAGYRHVEPPKCANHARYQKKNVFLGFGKVSASL
jgi:hypothetical protein